MTTTSPHAEEEICGVVLAGGQSRRMGKSKPLIPFNGKTLIEQATGVLSGLFSQVVIVCDSLSDANHSYRHLPFRVLCDQNEGFGPMGGIEAALEGLQGKGLFVVAADMPFLKSAVIKEMLLHRTGYDWVVPKLEGQLHPLHAYYAPECLLKIRAAIRSRDLALHLLSTQVRTCFFPEKTFRTLDPKLRSVFNINTPEALEKAEILLSSKETSA